MTELVLKDIAVPSVNTYWRSICRKGFPRFYISKKGKEFKTALGLIASNKFKKPLENEIRVEIEYCYKGREKDIDNILKAILDSLNGIAFVDDKQVKELYVKKNRAQKNILTIKIKEIV